MEAGISRVSDFGVHASRAQGFGVPETYGSLCFSAPKSAAHRDKKSRAERLKAKMEPLFTKKKPSPLPGVDPPATFEPLKWNRPRLPEIDLFGRREATHT